MNANLRPAIEAAGPMVYEPTFVPKGRHLIQRIEVKLRTETIHRVFENQFEHVQGSIFYLDAIFPVSHHKSAEHFADVMDLLNKRFDRVEKALADEFARLTQVAKNEGVEVVDDYTVDMSQIFPIYTPRMARWVALLSQADEMLSLVDALWYATIFDSVTRAEFIHKWRNALSGFSREISNIHKRVFFMVRQLEAKDAKGKKKAGQADAGEGGEVPVAVEDEAIEDAPDTTALSRLDTHLEKEIVIGAKAPGPRRGKAATRPVRSARAPKRPPPADKDVVVEVGQTAGGSEPD